MSDVKISELPDAGEITGDELLPLVQDNETKKTSVDDIKAFIEADSHSIRVVVANDAARFALTSDAVKNGSIVYVTATGFYYTVADQTQLASAEGYMGPIPVSGASQATFNNANYTVPPGFIYVGQIGTLSAPRIVTLPLAGSTPAGSGVVIADESGSITAVNTLVISRNGSDTVNGGVNETIIQPYGLRRFVSDGSSKWTFEGGLSRLAAEETFTGAKTFSKVPTIQGACIDIGSTTVVATNTTTLTDSPLSIALEVGTYEIDSRVGCISSAFATAGSKINYTFTGTASESGAMIFEFRNASNTLAQAALAYNSAGTTLLSSAGYMVNAAQSIGYWGRTSLVVTVAGNFKVQMAQNTAVAAQTVSILRGSYIRVFKKN